MPDWPGTAPLEPEQALLTCLARIDLPDAKRAQGRALLGRSDLRWKEVIRQARAHKVAPLVHRQLQTFFPEFVPPQAEEHLRTLVRAFLRRTLLLRRTLPSLLAVLERQGVRAVPFKGPVLAAQAYPSETLRAFSDLDLLVRPQEVSRAEAALQGAGFEARFAAPPALPRRPHSKSYVQGKGTPGEVPLDLHWGLTPGYFSFPMDLEELRERRVPVRLEGGHEARAFSAEDTLLFLCAHATKHRWKELRCVCDVAELVRSHPAMDWTQALRRARALRSERMLLVGVRLAETLLGAPVPGAVSRRAAAQPRVAALSKEAEALLFGRRRGAKTLGGRLKKAARVSRFHVRVRERRRDGLSAGLYHLRLVTAPTPEDRAWLDLPGALSFLYPLVRALRTACEALPGGGRAFPETTSRAAGLWRDRPRKLNPPEHRKMKKIAQLRFRDVKVLAVMLWLLAKLAVLKRALPLPALVRAFDPAPGGNDFPKREAQADEADEEVSRLVWLSRALLRRTHRRNFCMEQSLVLFYFLRKRNYPARIYFGVKRKGKEMAGHAWVEVDGRPAFEGDDSRLHYATTYSYPSHKPEETSHEEQQHRTPTVAERRRAEQPA